MAMMYKISLKRGIVVMNSSGKCRIESLCFHILVLNICATFFQDSLKMVCVRPIHKGQEVFNTYGQMANWQLLHMYGFTEPCSSNSNDTADIPVAKLYEAAARGER